MPAKLSVGMSKKVGLPAYSSVGASCQVECEIEGAVLEDAYRFRQKTEQLFNACQQAIEEQLFRETSPTNQSPNGSSGHVHPTALALENSNEPEPGQTLPKTAELLLERGISERQLIFLQDLCSQIDGLGIRRLPVLVALEFDKNLTELSSSEASQLIGLLRKVRAGKVALENLLERDEHRE